LGPGADLEVFEKTILALLEFEARIVQPVSRSLYRLKRIVPINSKPTMTSMFQRRASKQQSTHLGAVEWIGKIPSWGYKQVPAFRHFPGCL
jgi:hypothetical protein